MVSTCYSSTKSYYLWRYVSYHFFYHVKMLLHFSEGREVNFHFFLHKILYKITKGVQSASKNLETGVCHHILIKMLVVAKLSKRRISWEDFLVEIFLGVENQVKWQQRFIKPLSKNLSSAVEVPLDSSSQHNHSPAVVPMSTTEKNCSVKPSKTLVNPNTSIETVAPILGKKKCKKSKVRKWKPSHEKAPAKESWS